MIYICIPTHNEQQTVGVVLWKLRQVLTEFPRDYQLLVADDASTDKTTDVLEPYTRVLPLTVIRSEQRQGYAASLEMLLREAVRRSEYPKRDVIVTLQADFSEEPDDVVALIKRMEAGADVAVGIKISKGPQTRMRRLARYVSGFFARKQSWPEGVVTPFDGYRAYRLHAIKRAMEERGEARLIRYEGWAAHAELLRAVLPHARRVEALDVEDRCDRLQRPRREKPIAAALQVRAMASGAEPAGLLSVEDLDRTAATASRSRDRAVTRQNGDVRVRANGGNGRDRRPAAQDARRRPERSGRPERPERSGGGEAGRGERAGRSRSGSSDRPESAGRGRAAPGREQGAGTGRAGGRAEQARRGAAEQGRSEGGAQPEQQRRRTRRGGSEEASSGAASAPAASAGAVQARVAGAGEPGDGSPDRPLLPPSQSGLESSAPLDAAVAGGAEAAGDVTAAAGAGGAPESQGDEAPRPRKRRRRRRSRSGGSAGGGADESGAEPAGADESSAESTGAGPQGGASLRGAAADAGGNAEGSSGDDDGEGGESAGGERKRRRRGGRRGGRGRRRGPRPEGEQGTDGGDGLDGSAREDMAGGGDTGAAGGVAQGGTHERADPRADVVASADAADRD